MGVFLSVVLVWPGNDLVYVFAFSAVFSRIKLFACMTLNWDHVSQVCSIL